MGFMDQIGGLLNQYLSGSPPNVEQVHLARKSAGYGSDRGHC